MRRRGEPSHTEWWEDAHLEFPLRTDLLAVAPHHVLHAQLTQVFRCLRTQTGRQSGSVCACVWVSVCECVSPPPRSEQGETSASSCPAHSWAGSCAASWGRSSARNPGSTHSLGSAPCAGRWSLWWTCGGREDFKACGTRVTPCDRVYYLRMVLAASRLRRALLLARIPLHQAWMAIATTYNWKLKKNRSSIAPGGVGDQMWMDFSSPAVLSFWYFDLWL